MDCIFPSNRQQAVGVNGSLSSWEQVTSRVPQDSVLGLALFFSLYDIINQHLQSVIRLFTDGSIIYKEITSPSDHNALQKDLESLAVPGPTPGLCPSMLKNVPSCQ